MADYRVAFPMPTQISFSNASKRSKKAICHDKKRRNILEQLLRGNLVPNSLFCLKFFGRPRQRDGKQPQKGFSKRIFLFVSWHYFVALKLLTGNNKRNERRKKWERASMTLNLWAKAKLLWLVDWLEEKLSRTNTRAAPSKDCAGNNDVGEKFGRLGT